MEIVIGFMAGQSLGSNYKTMLSRGYNVLRHTDDGRDVELDTCSSYQSITRPLDMLEMLCDKYEVIVWVGGHDTLYTLGYGMVIQDERPMRS